MYLNRISIRATVCRPLLPFPLAAACLLASNSFPCLAWPPNPKNCIGFWPLLDYISSLPLFLCNSVSLSLSPFCLYISHLPRCKLAALFVECKSSPHCDSKHHIDSKDAPKGHHNMRKVFLRPSASTSLESHFLIKSGHN